MVVYVYEHITVALTADVANFAVVDVVVYVDVADGAPPTLNGSVHGSYGVLRGLPPSKGRVGRHQSWVHYPSHDP